MYLSLPIPPNMLRGVSLADCLAKFLEKEALDGSDAWLCTKCKVPRRSSKQLWLSRLPHVLMIHLKRFYFQGPYRNQVDTFVDFPLRSLDLSPQLRYKDPSTGVSYVYDLYAISVSLDILTDRSVSLPLDNCVLTGSFAPQNHYGGLNGGHYTAFVRSGYRQGQWYHFDDSRVTPLPESDVKVGCCCLFDYTKPN